MSKGQRNGDSAHIDAQPVVSGSSPSGRVTALITHLRSEAQDYSWLTIPGALADARPAHRRGVSTVEGLYFLGLAWQHSRGSALLGFVGDDAEHLADLTTTADESARSGLATPSVL